MSSPASLVDIYPNFFEGLFSDDDDDHFDEVLQYPTHTNSVVVTNLDAAESTTTERKATDQENEEGLELKRKQYSERLRQKIRELQELIPNSNKTDRPPALLLDDAINYFTYLNHQVQYVQYVHKMLSMSRGPPFVPTIPLLGMGMGYPMYPLPASRHYQPLLPLAVGFNPVRGSYIADSPLTLNHLYQRRILHATQVVPPSNTMGNEDPERRVLQMQFELALLLVIECGCGGGCVDGFPTCCCELCWSCDDDGDGDDGCSGGGNNGDGDDGCSGGGNNGGCSRDDVQHRGV